MASGARRCLAAAMMACAGCCESCLPALATTGDATGVCTGSATLTFATALSKVPLPGLDGVTLGTPTPLTCTGVIDQTATLTFSGSALPGAACTGPLAVTGSGGIAFSVSPGVSSVTWGATGTPYAEAWQFASAGGPLFATGTVVSLAPTDAISCATSGTSTLTLTATIAVVA